MASPPPAGMPAPTAAKVIARIAPLLDLEPRFDLPKADQLILAKAVASQ